MAREQPRNTSNRSSSPRPPFSYEDRLVAFIDVLGWSKATIARPAHELLSALEPMLAPAEVHNSTFREQLVKRHGEKVNPLFLQVQYGFFSDSLVFSMPVSFGERIVDVAADRCRRFLLQGYACRGVITAGKLYHKDSCIFGPALVQAALLEKERAIYPRVLVDDSALKFVKTSRAGLLTTDQLGDTVANPYDLGLDGISNTEVMNTLDIPKCVEAIEKGIARSLDDKRVRDKWCYLAVFTKIALSAYRPESDRLINRLENVAK